MLEAMAHFNLDAFTHLFSAGEVMGPYSRPSVSQSYVLECADGKWIALHMSSPEKFWQGLATAIEQPDMFQDPRFADARGAHRAPGRADRGARRASSRAHARRVVPPARGARTCRTRRCTTPRGAGRSAGASTCSSSSDRSIRRWALFRTVRSPVSFDGERALEVRPPPHAGRAQRSDDATSRPAAPARARSVD